jgi:hypothetical protein
MNSSLQKLLAKAYIIGGSPCSGKSSVAEMLSSEYGLSYYKADDHDGEHFQRCRPEQQPVMFKYSKMSWDDIWSQPVAQLLVDELAYYRERFPFILDDLYKLDLEKTLLLEGAAFLPELVNHFSLERQNVVFMVPTAEFQIQHYRQRPWIQEILAGCRDPFQAFDNWMERDTLFGREIIHQANACGFSVLPVDGSVPLAIELEQIRAQFGLK